MMKPSTSHHKLHVHRNTAAPTSRLAEIQCMRAPEFNSHSESLALVVK